MSNDGKIHPVVLCGGSGTRLWPLSRKDRPKPFRKLLGDRTLFQQTLARVADRCRFEPPTIIAGSAHAPLVDEQLGSLNASVIVEPCARNTAPAIALAAQRLPRDAVMLVCPSDHAIQDNEAFLAGVAKAQTLARDARLVAFGITPTQPETGYGYIEVGESSGGGNMVARFVEKPDIDRAREFLASGNFVWNGGIFVFRAGDFLDELARYRPVMASQAEQAVVRGDIDSMHHFHPEPTTFAAIEGESIDFAIMENTDRAAVVAADMGWSDIGDWSALFAARKAARISTKAKLDLVAASNVDAFSDGPRISVVGVSDILVVVDGDEVLVTSREAAQKVGQLPGASKQ